MRVGWDIMSGVGVNHVSIICCLWHVCGDSGPYGSGRSFVHLVHDIRSDVVDVGHNVCLERSLQEILLVKLMAVMDMRDTRGSSSQTAGLVLDIILFVLDRLFVSLVKLDTHHCC